MLMPEAAYRNHYHRRVVSVRLRVLFLGIVFLIMTGARSAYSTPTSQLTKKQWKRLEGDRWYRTSHSTSGKKFVEVERTVAPAVKCMAQAKLTHHQRDAALGSSSSFGRDASFAAESPGIIDSSTLRSDLKQYKQANIAKHTGRLERTSHSASVHTLGGAVPRCSPWADDCVDEDLEIVPKQQQQQQQQQLGAPDPCEVTEAPQTTSVSGATADDVVPSPTLGGLSAKCDSATDLVCTLNNTIAILTNRLEQTSSELAAWQSWWFSSRTSYPLWSAAVADASVAACCVDPLETIIGGADDVRLSDLSDRITSLEAQLKASATAVVELRSSLGDSAQSAVDARSTSLTAAIGSQRRLSKAQLLSFGMTQKRCGHPSKQNSQHPTPIGQLRCT